MNMVRLEASLESIDSIYLVIRGAALRLTYFRGCFRTAKLDDVVYSICGVVFRNCVAISCMGAESLRFVPISGSSSNLNNGDQSLKSCCIHLSRTSLYQKLAQLLERTSELRALCRWMLGSIQTCVRAQLS